MFIRTLMTQFRLLTKTRLVQCITGVRWNRAA